MGIIYKRFDGEPVIGVSSGDRLANWSGHAEEWSADHFDDVEDADSLDVWELMEGAETTVRGSRSEAVIFDAAPSEDALLAVFKEAVLECAEAGVFRSVDVSYRAFCREWYSTAHEEGLDVSCPNYSMFEHAVAAEVGHRSGPSGAPPRPAYRVHPTFPNFGE